MSEDERAQCLLFVAADRKPGSARKSSRASANPLIKGYALIPQTFSDEHPEVIELFLRNDIRVLTNVQDDPSFQMALKNYSFEMFEIQLMSESFESEDGQSDLPNRLLVLVDSFNKEVLGLRLSRNANVFCLMDDERTGYISVTDDDLKVVEHFLSFSKDIAYRHFKGGSILHFAVKRGRVNLLKLLLQCGVNVNVKRPDCSTALHIAAKKGLVEIVEILAENGAEINARELDDVTPLHLAAGKGQIEIVETLLRHGGDINAIAETETHGGYTPLALAYQNWHHEVGRLLLKSGANVNIQFFDNVLRPSILYLASPEERLEGVSRATILYTTTHEKDYEDIKLILHNQPDVNDEYNKRAFHYILFELEDDFKDIFKLMKQHGFMIDNDRFENSVKFLCGAIHKNCYEVVRRMVEEGVNVNEVYESRFFKKLTPLHMAARHAGVDVIQLLLNAGADINAEFGSGTPIFGAVENRNVDAVKLLVANKADFRNKPGLAALAAGTGSVEMVEFLLMNGYPLSFEDEYNMAIVRATNGGHAEVIECLFEYGAQLSSEIVNYSMTLRNAIMGEQPEIYQAIADHNFINEKFIEESEVFQNFDLFDLFLDHVRQFHPVSYESCLNILGQHLVKLEAAGLCVSGLNAASLWHMDESVDVFQKRCEEEIAQMKNLRVGCSKVSFYDMLTQRSSRLAGLARNDSIVETMKADNYCAEFPIYSSVLKRQFKKGYRRVELMKQGIKTSSILFPQKRFRNLPNELKVKIVNYLSNCDLLVLSNILPVKTQ